MRNMIRVGVVACLLQCVHSGYAREWTSKDGTSRVEAKLLTVEDGRAVLKRQDRVVIRVPLDRLSSADAEYIQEAMKAVSATSREAPARDTSVSGAPPLTDASSSRWQVVPDPTPSTYDLKPDASLEIHVGGEDSSPVVLYPSVPSPFVALAKDDFQRRLQIWDLRKGEAIRTLVGQFGRVEQMALSPDGIYLVNENITARGTIKVWSIADGNVVRTIKVPENHSHIDFRALVGSKRLIVGDSSQVDYLVYDLPSGDLSCRVDFGSGYTDRKCTLSPGGNYLAAFSSRRRQLAFYDTRNGICAGRIDLDAGVPSRAESLTFSLDGKELAAWFVSGIDQRLLAWDLTSGEQVVSYEFKREFDDNLWIKSYAGMPLEWIPGRQGWLLNGLAIIDRASGKTIWRDAGQLENYDDVLPQRFVDAERMLRIQPEKGKGLTLRLAPRPDMVDAALNVVAKEEPAAPGDMASRSPDAQAAVEQKASPEGDKTPVEVEPDSPPLAREGVSGWQAAPDPPQPGFEVKPDAAVEIRVSRKTIPPFFLFPTAPSPFVVLGVNRDQGQRFVWDLRTGETVGDINGEIAMSGYGEMTTNSFNRLAVSPDGKYLARQGIKTGDKLDIWSFATGKLAHQIELPDGFDAVFLDFAGPRRVVLGSRYGQYLLFDAINGAQYGQIEVGENPGFLTTAISPGGTYLVVGPVGDQGHRIYDTRNGLQAGRLQSDTEGWVAANCFVFSPDGRELASWHGKQARQTVLAVWDMASGRLVVTHRRDMDNSDPLYRSQYRNRALEWLPGGGGWLLYGSAVVDRESGEIVWRDDDAIRNSLELLPRRVVAGDRLLVCRKEEKAQMLRLEPLPMEKITSARAALAAGQNPADVGMPPLTEPDKQGMVAKTLTEVAWKYAPNADTVPNGLETGKPFALGEGIFAKDGFYFSDANAARVAVARLESEPESLQDSTNVPTQACQLHDLRTGNKAAEFKPPYPAALIDLSPDGKLGLFWHVPSQERLDIWDVETGEHVLGFRPFEGERAYERKVTWARFADQNHIVTMAGPTNIIGWELSGCRAVYSYPTRGRKTGALRTGIATLSSDRRTMVVLDLNTPHLIDTVSGDLVGNLPDVSGYEKFGVSDAAISPDGKRLAIVDALKENTLLIQWDLTSGTRIMQTELPLQAFGLVWCGPDHLLLKTYDTSHFRPIVDVNRGLVVWKLRVDGGESLWKTPDGNHWCLRLAAAETPAEFGAISLPDDRALSALAKAEIPAPLVGAGTSVAVQTLVEDPPQAIPPGWPELENLEETLREHFSEHLKDKQVNVNPAGNVRLVVGIRQDGGEGKTTIRDPYSGRSATVLISALQLTPYVEIFDAKGKRIWEKRGALDDKELDLEKRPENIDAVTYIKLQHWEAALRWLRAVEVPCPIYDPEAHRGLGGSVVGKKGK